MKRDLPSTELFDNWRIQDKTGDEILGFVRFRSGKLTLASKIWTHESKEYSGADTAGIIYKVLSKFVAEGKMKLCHSNLRIPTAIWAKGAGI